MPPEARQPGSRSSRPIRPRPRPRPRRGPRTGGAESPLLPCSRSFGTISPDDRERMKSAGLDERVEILKKAGFTEDELRQIKGMAAPAGPTDGPPEGSDR